MPIKSYIELPVPQRTVKEVLVSGLRSAFRIRLKDVSIVSWLPKHRDWRTFASDVTAALVVSSLMLPQALAYALLAGVDPIYGLYSSIFPTIVFGLLTTSSQISPGPNAPSAILMQAMVASLTSAAPRSAEFTRVTNAFGFVVGLVLILLSLLRFGIIAQFLSWPVMSGFTTGAAITILASQLQPFFGVTVPKEDNSVMKIIRVLEHLDTTKWQVFLVGFFSLIIIMYAKKIKIGRFQLPSKTPVSLIVVLVSVGFSYGFDFKGKGIATVGKVPNSLPIPTAPPLDSASELVGMLPAAALLAVINYVQTISVELFLAKKVGETVNPSTELLALGASGVVGSCFSAHAISGGFTRSAVQNQAGAKTPLVIVLTGVVLLICTVSLSVVFSYIPNATLAGMIIAAAIQLVNIKDLVTMWKNNMADLIQSVVTAGFVIALGLEKGIMAGVAMSFLLILYRSFTPRFTVLGKLPGTRTWVATYRYPQAQQVPGSLVARLDGELNFGNIAPALSQLQAHIAGAEAKQAKMPAMDTSKPASVRAVVTVHDDDASADDGPILAPEGVALSVSAEGEPRPTAISSVIIDSSRIVGVDGTACKELREFVDRLEKNKVNIFFVAMPGPVRDMMERYGVDGGACGKNNPCLLKLLSTEAAFAFMKEKLALTPEQWNDRLVSLKEPNIGLSEASDDFPSNRAVTEVAADAAP